MFWRDRKRSILPSRYLLRTHAHSNTDENLSRSGLWIEITVLKQLPQVQLCFMECKPTHMLLYTLDCTHTLQALHIIILYTFNTTIPPFLSDPHWTGYVAEASAEAGVKLTSSGNFAMSTDSLRNYIESNCQTFYATQKLTNKRILVGTGIGTWTLTDYHREQLIQTWVNRSTSRFIYNG